MNLLETHAQGNPQGRGGTGASWQDKAKAGREARLKSVRLSTG